MPGRYGKGGFLPQQARAAERMGCHRPAKLPSSARGDQGVHGGRRWGSTEADSAVASGGLPSAQSVKGTGSGQLPRFRGPGGATP